MKLTEKEIYIIEAIISNEMCGNNYHLPSQDASYEDAYEGDCWADMIPNNGARHGERVTGKAISGVVASLSKKGYVKCEKGERASDDVVGVTKAGWEAYQKAKLKLNPIKK